MHAVEHSRSSCTNCQEVLEQVTNDSKQRIADLQAQRVLEVGHDAAGWVVVRVLGVVRGATVVDGHALELNLQHAQKLVRPGMPRS